MGLSKRRPIATRGSSGADHLWRLWDIYDAIRERSSGQADCGTHCQMPWTQRPKRPGAPSLSILSLIICQIDSNSRLYVGLLCPARRRSVPIASWLAHKLCTVQHPIAPLPKRRQAMDSPMFAAIRRLLPGLRQTRTEDLFIIGHKCQLEPQNN